MTHVLGLDFNSLYPSAYSSNYNSNNPYTDHKMYMAGRIKETIITESQEQKQRALEIINQKDQLFIVEIKGHIQEEYINDFINFPPIFRNLTIKTTRNQIGDYMYDYMQKNKLKTDTEETKLTMLLSTHDQFMSFSSYYLWFLIDYCHFIIDDIKSIILFTKHDKFNNFVNEFMNNRIKAKLAKNNGLEQFCKTSLNGSYGYDGKNTEKYTKTVIKNKDQTYVSQISDSFISSRQINDDAFFVTYNPRSFKCDTCIQESYFTLDNAKFWYLNFVYNFMYKCLDMNKMHFVEGDTDSAYWAIAGKPRKDYHQKFEHVIKDKKFYDEHIYEWLPDPNKDMYDEKKLLGMAIEKEDENCVALAPKCYCLFPNCNITKTKGINKCNKFTSTQYKDILDNQTVFQGTNVNLQLKYNKMSKITNGIINSIGYECGGLSFKSISLMKIPQTF
jgi:hypothetical protein